MKPNEPEDPAKIKNERDCLLKIVEGAQQREREAERVIKLLIAAGIVDEEKIAQAREIARWNRNAKCYV